MSLDEYVREDREFFNKIQQRHSVLSSVTGGNTTLTQMVRDYSEQFMDLVNISSRSMDEYQEMQFQWDIAKYEKVISELVAVLEKIETRLPHSTNLVAAYENEKEKSRMRKIYRWVRNGGTTSVAAGVCGLILGAFFGPALLLPSLILIGSGSGASILGGNKYINSSKGNPDKIISQAEEYFSQLENVAERADHRINLAYLPERFNRNRALFEDAYRRFSPDERQYCGDVLAKMHDKPERKDLTKYLNRLDDRFGGD